MHLGPVHCDRNRKMSVSKASFIMEAYLVSACFYVYNPSWTERARKNSSYNNKNNIYSNISGDADTGPTIRPMGAPRLFRRGTWRHIAVRSVMSPETPIIMSLLIPRFRDASNRI
jgi:hypothetical protein